MRFDSDEFKDEICRALEEGRGVREAVRRLTLHRISAANQDLGDLKRIIQAALEGIRRGVAGQVAGSSVQGEARREALRDAVDGLDAALAQFAMASRLALEEAASRAKQVSKDDLERLKADLESLDTLFVEAVQNAASRAKDGSTVIWCDLAAHFRINGSAVGIQAREALSAATVYLKDAARAQLGDGWRLAQATAKFTCLFAAGALGGLADTLEKGKGERAGH